MATDPIIMLPIISQLKDRGIALVTANFDGQGDSGEVYEILYEDIDGNYIDFNPPKGLENFIWDGIEKLVNSYGGDWVNNDGGYGNFYINVKDMNCR
jgi:hypothetical protein